MNPLANPVDIRPDHLEIVQGILSERLPSSVKVWVFGSRANWSTKDSSDLDLALEGENALSHKLLGVLKDAFEDSSLPYTVDVVDLNQIGDSFRQSVELQRVLLPLGGDWTSQQARLAVPFSSATPSQWRETTLGEVLTFSNGESSPQRFEEVQHPVYGSNGIIGFSDQTNTGHNAIVIGRVGSYCGSLYFSDRPCWVTDNAIRGNPVDGNDARFLFYLLRTLDLNQWRAGSGQPLLNQSILSSIPVLVPPVPEQRAIAHILGTLDDKIELNRRMNETLEAMARALFKSWFVDFHPVRAKMEGRWRPGESLPGLPAHLYDLFPDRLVDSELGEIPEGWVVKALGDICTFRSGAAFPRALQGKPKGTFPFVKVSDMKLPANSFGMLGSVHWVDDSDLAYLKVKPILKDATIFAKIGEALKQNRFRLTVRPTLIDNNLMSAMAKREAVGPSILYFLLSRFDLGEISGGTALPYLTVSSLSSLKVVVPSVTTQVEMERALNTLSDRILRNSIESSGIVEVRNDLLPKLLSGGIGVGIATHSDRGATS